ncbi:MAG TPA: DUF6683 family protein [Pyrinomonadaceae bacterium]|jgi:hypothetical protein
MMKYTRLSMLLMASALLLLSGALKEASAQYTGPYGGANNTRWGNPTQATTSLLLQHSIQSQSRRLQQRIRSKNSPTRQTSPVRGSRSSKTRAGRTPHVASTTGATTFQPVAPSIVPQRLAAAAGASDAERREMETFFNQCLKNYEDNRRKQGMPVKDVSLAVSYLIGVSYNVFNGGNALTATQGDALRAQIRDALADDTDFHRLSNRDKQTMYETMAVIGEFVAINSDVAAQKNNKQLAEMAREMAKDNLERLLGAPASQIRITNNGVEF